MIYTFPTLDVKFHVSAKDSFDGLEVYEINLKENGIAIKPHFHQFSEEFFYVVLGSLLFHVNGDEFILRQGESFLVKRGMAHGFRAIDCDYAKILCSCRNAGRMEKYVARMESFIANQEMNQDKWCALTMECDQQRLHGIHEYIDS